MSLMIEMPDPVVQAMRLPELEAPERMRRELALRLYAKQLLGFGKARELAGLSVWEFSQLLGAEGISRHYDENDLADDLQTLKEIE